MLRIIIIFALFASLAFIRDISVLISFKSVNNFSILIFIQPIIIRGGLVD